MPGIASIWFPENETIYQFKGISRTGLCNPGFGNIDLVTGELSDEIRANNGDRNQILATIEAAVRHFFCQDAGC